MVIGNKGGIKKSHSSILYTNSTGNTKFCNSEKVRQEIRTFTMYSKAHEKKILMSEELHCVSINDFVL